LQKYFSPISRHSVLSVAECWSDTWYCRSRPPLPMLCIMDYVASIRELFNWLSDIRHLVTHFTCFNLANTFSHMCSKLGRSWKLCITECRSTFPVWNNINKENHFKFFFKSVVCCKSWSSICRSSGAWNLTFENKTKRDWRLSHSLLMSLWMIYDYSLVPK